MQIYITITQKYYKCYLNKITDIMKLVLVVLFQFFGAIFATPTSCTTPNNDVGVCVEIRECSIFMDAIRSRKVESNDFMRQSQCGTLNRDPASIKVCCGIYNNYVGETTTVRTNARLQPNQDPFPKICGKYLPSDLNDERVLGGTETELGQFPWMARLRHHRSDGLLSYGCAGFLISERFVLTAAHCIYSEVLGALGPIYQVQLGEHNTEEDIDCSISEQKCADAPQWIRIAEPIVHPDYSNDSQHHNDIAVIPLREPAILTDYVSPICLSETSSHETYMWLAGWGKTETRQISFVKLQVAVPRADQTKCSELYRTRGITVRNSQLCAGGESGRDSCTGDSGGPLMVVRNSTWYAEGIVSVGKGCGEKDWPGIYTNIAHFMPWIELVVSQYLEEHDEEGTQKQKVVGNQLDNGYVWNK